MHSSSLRHVCFRNVTGPDLLENAASASPSAGNAGWRVLSGELRQRTLCNLLRFGFVAAISLLSFRSTASPDEPGQITATFSIVACDPVTGEVGAAVASKYPAVGKVVPLVKAGVGAFCTQHYHVPAWREPAIQMLQDGLSPEQVLAELLEEDDRPEQRQLAIIDAQGRVAVHNPTQAPERSRYWGAMTGRYYSCQGNTLTGSEVIVEMAKAYESTDGTLSDRLMAALVAGDKAGGDHRGRLAAGIRVARGGENGFVFELDVDESDDAVNELAKLYEQKKQPAAPARKE